MGFFSDHYFDQNYHFHSEILLNNDIIYKVYLFGNKRLVCSFMKKKKPSGDGLKKQHTRFLVIMAAR